ncbi:MAG: flippase-like domain-containing protein [Deltaproteobacteria bacterium]|nr:flippase-like domain-containing protein [Deltaproteobacteria bacterium]
MANPTVRPDVASGANREKPPGTSVDASVGRGAEASRGRRLLFLGAKIAVSGLALWWTLARVDTRTLVRQAASTSALTFAIVVGLVVANLAVGAVRWRVLATAYGAEPSALPSVLVLFRLYVQGLFYNTFLPGNVGGDVLRAWIVGRAMRDAAGAGTVVLVERVLGLAGLALVASVAATVAALPGLDLRLWGSLALVATLAGVALLSVLPGLAPRLPGAAGRFAAKLPRLVRPAAFAQAVVLSVGTQLLAAYAGHVLLESSSGHDLPIARSLAVVPVTVLASYFPFTVAGIGAREAAFVSLAAQLGVGADAATAASLLLLGATLVVAIAGGVVSLLPLPRALTRVALDEAAPPSSPDA